MAVYQSLTVTQISQSVENNSSQVRILWESTQNGSSHNLVEHEANYWICVNGQPEQMHTITYTLPKQTVQTLVDVTVTVPHNDKGEAEITVRTWMNTHISAGVVELSQTLIPDTIPRASTIRATDALIGGFSRLAITKRSSAYTHSVAWQFGQAGGFLLPSGEISQEETVFSGESVDFRIPDYFYEEIPNKKSDVCRLTVKTYHGALPVGQPQTAMFTVTGDETLCGPLVTGNVTDVCEKTLALTGDSHILVRYFSQVQCVISATGRMGAAVTAKRIQDQTVEGDSLVLENYAGETIRFQVEDSRGYTAGISLQPEQIPYVKLSGEAMAERDGPVSEEATLYISGDCFAGSFGTVDNSLTVSYSIDGGAYIPMEPLLTEDHRFYASASLTGMDYTRVYGITVAVEDKLSRVEKQVILKKGVPVFDWGENDFAFHVPVRMDTPLTMENGGTGATVPEEAWENLGLTIPMTAGLSYATWHRWMGKQVYTALIVCGNMPNNGCISFYHGLPATGIIGCTAMLSDGRMLPWGGTHNARAEVYCDLGKIYLDTGGDFSRYTATVQIFYIKD